MKVIAMYSIFNGLELLEKSIKQIEPFVDKVILCYQHQSNNGLPMSQKDLDILNSANIQQYDLLCFEPKEHLNAKANERLKYQLRLDYAKKYGFTHYITLACDHYYETEQLKKAFEIYNANPVDVTATWMYTYYKKPEWQLTPIEDYVMPFICKIYPSTEVTPNDNYPFKTDPSVRIKPADSFYLYGQDELMLHHYSMVRGDILGKFKNSAARVNIENRMQTHIEEWNNYSLADNKGITYFEGRKIKRVKNQFNIK